MVTVQLGTIGGVGRTGEKHSLDRLARGFNQCGTGARGVGAATQGVDHSHVLRRLEEKGYLVHLVENRTLYTVRPRRGSALRAEPSNALSTGSARGRGGVAGGHGGLQSAGPGRIAAAGRSDCPGAEERRRSKNLSGTREKGGKR